MEKEIIDVDSLYCYAKNILKNDIVEARKLFHKCYELDHKHKATYNQLLIEAISEKKYDVAYMYLCTNRVLRYSEHNLYLYLLSYLTEVSDEDRKYINKFDYDDISYIKQETNDIEELENSICYDIINGDFKSALVKSYIKRERNGRVYPKDIIVNALLKEIINKEKDLQRLIGNYIEEDNLWPLVYLLNDELSRHPINKIQDCIYEIAMAILSTREKNIMYEKRKDYYKEDLFSAIYSHNYAEAKRIIQKYPKGLENKNEANRQLIKLLLQVIDEEKLSLNKKEEEQKEVKEYIESKISILSVSNPIEIIDNYSEDYYEYVSEVVKNNDGVKCYFIFDDSKSKIVLKKQLKNTKNNIYKKLLSNEQNDYNNKKYDQVIIESKKLLCFSEEPEPYIYAHIGKCYEEKGDYGRAIDYYKLSSFIGLNQKKEEYQKYYDHAKNLEKELIMKVITTQEEFDTTKKYNDLYDLILTDDISIDKAKEKYNLKEKDINVLKLMNAKALYGNRNFKCGDILYKEVESSKEKSPLIKKMLNEIVRNKKFYQYQKTTKKYIKIKKS